MRQLYLSLLAVLIIFLSSANCSDLGRDGFNFYKDYLRARSDENLEEEPLPERMSYFYRTPVQIYSGLLPNADQAYRKRTGNVFKNRMLNKELWIGVAPNKRSSKTALSLMLHSKQPYHTYETPRTVISPIRLPNIAFVTSSHTMEESHIQKANNISGEDMESYV